MKGKFVARSYCAKCNSSLSREEEYSSDGVCPYCGHVSRSTVCDTVKRSVRVQPGLTLFERFVNWVIK